MSYDINVIDVNSSKEFSYESTNGLTNRFAVAYSDDVRIVIDKLSVSVVLDDDSVSQHVVAFDLGESVSHVVRYAGVDGGVVA